MGVDFGKSRLPLLSFLSIKLSCNGGPFCINLGNLSVDLQLNLVGFSLAEHADVSRYDYWDLGVDIDTNDLFVNYNLWTIRDGLGGCIEVLLGSIPGRSLCLNCLL